MITLFSAVLQIKEKMGAGIDRDYFSGPTADIMAIKTTPPKLPLQDSEDNLVYMLKKEFEIPGQFGQSEIEAISTKKDMIFDMARDLAKKEYIKPSELREWDLVVLIFDNKTGKFLDKVDIPKYRPKA